jgi:hypothetical protein
MPIINYQQLQQELQQLQQQNEAQQLDLRQQYQHTVNSFKPINLLKAAAASIGRNAGVTSAAVGGTLAISAGMLSKKIVTGGSSSLLRNMMGKAVAFAVAKSIAVNAGTVTTAGIKLLKRWLK